MQEASELKSLNNSEEADGREKIYSLKHTLFSPRIIFSKETQPQLHSLLKSVDPSEFLQSKQTEIGRLVIVITTWSPESCNLLVQNFKTNGSLCLVFAKSPQKLFANVSLIDISSLLLFLSHR